MRKRYQLSHAHIFMARELGINTRKIGSIAHDMQQPLKARLPIFIEDLYCKRFGRERPEVVLTLEQIAKGLSQ